MPLEEGNWVDIKEEASFNSFSHDRTECGMRHACMMTSDPAHMIILITCISYSLMKKAFLWFQPLAGLAVAVYWMHRDPYRSDPAARSRAMSAQI